MDTTPVKEAASTPQSTQKPPQEAPSNDGGDVTTPEDVVIEEEEEILELSQTDVTKTSQNDVTSGNMSELATELIGDDNAMEENSHPEVSDSTLDIGQWQQSGNENPFEQASDSQTHETETQEHKMDPLEAAAEAKTPGVLKISKSAARKEKKGQAASETAMEEGGEKKEKKKPKKLRGGRQIKGRTQ